MNISIILNSLNQGEFIEDAIKSVLHQNYPRELYEIIVVDACSTDTTGEILKEYNDELKIVYQREKLGLAVGCNLGIKASSGQYIVRLDADDIFYKNILLVESMFLDDNEDIDFVYPDYNVKKREFMKRVRLPPFDPVEIRERGDFLGGGTMYRRKTLDAYGYYDESLKSIENYELILRLLKNSAKGLHIPLPLYEYNFRDDSMSSDEELMIKVGTSIGEQYGFNYQIGENHPRNIDF